jgi:hypothetical protein
MANKTRKAKKTTNSSSVWGKHPKLERFWGDFASGKQTLVIYRDGTNKYVKIPKRFTEKYTNTFNGFDEDSNVVAVLFSYPSQDSYEQYLYPKAKDKTVEYVIKNYTKYFKPMGPVPKDILATGAPPMKKVRVPL